MIRSSFIGLLVARLLGGVALAAGLQPGFFPVHQSEPYLLHRKVDAVQLHELKVWDTRLATWRAMQPAEVPAERAPVVVLHFWADWCLPCREEFPAVRQLMESMEKQYGDRVQVLLVSETSGPEEMRAFLDKYRSRLPRGPHYLDTGEAIAARLRADLPTPLSYPITVVLDSRRIVTHAVVGPITARRLEVQDAIARILAIGSTSSPTVPH